MRYAGAKGQLTVRADSGFYTHAIVAACRKRVRFSLSIRQHQSLRDIIKAIPESEWTPISYWMEGAADVAENGYIPFQSKPDAVPVRFIVQRVKPTPGTQQDDCKVDAAPCHSERSEESFLWWRYTWLGHEEVRDTLQSSCGSQLALFVTYSYHAFITDRDGNTLDLEAGHRRHAEVENAIRDLKYGVVLNQPAIGPLSRQS